MSRTHHYSRTQCKKIAGLIEMTRCLLRSSFLFFLLLPRFHSLMQTPCWAGPRVLHTSVSFSERATMLSEATTGYMDDFLCFRSNRFLSQVHSKMGYSGCAVFKWNATWWEYKQF